jgi:hypothetical protein
MDEGNPPSPLKREFLKCVINAIINPLSLRGGTTKQPRPTQYTSDEVAALSLAMT